MMAKKPGAIPAPTARKATASDVAARAGVSKWTVSRAFTDGASISPHAMLRVQTAARELGYRPNLLARSLSKKSTRIIGLVADELKKPAYFHAAGRSHPAVAKPRLYGLAAEYHLGT